MAIVQRAVVNRVISEGDAELVASILHTLDGMAGDTRLERAKAERSALERAGATGANGRA